LAAEVKPEGLSEGARSRAEKQRAAPGAEQTVDHGDSKFP
jgi:hypothetical protein